MEALARGTVSGLIEAATEKLPLDNLLKIASSPVGKKAIWNILEQMGTEATEEAVSYVANYIADAAAKDPNAEFSLKDMMLSALGGGLSGGIMGAGGTVVGYARNGNVNAQAAQPTQKSAFTQQAGTDANAAQSAAQVDSAGHTPEMQRTIAEYQAAVDPGIAAFVKKILGMRNRNATSKLNLPLSEVGQDAASKINRLTGVNVAGYRHNMNGSAVNHIAERHGQAGKSDTSMANIEDIARIQYVLDRYDSLAPALTPEGNPDVTYAYHNSDGSPAKLVKYGKRIDGTYYVVEAAPDTASKKLQIISAYIQKTEGTPQAVDAKAPHLYVRNAHASVPSINPTLPQQADGVNTSIPGSGSENSRQPGLRSTNPDVQAMMDAQGRIRVARRTQRVFDRLGEKLGVNIIVDAHGNGENGYYDSQTRTIHLNADSRDLLGQVFSHEITHRLKEASSADYLAFAQLAEEQLRRTGEYDSLASRIRDAYGELSPDALADEMVAHYAQNLVTSIDEFERLAGINRNLAQKLLDWLDEILHQTQLSLQGLTVDEQNEIFRRYTFNEVAAAAKAWKEALRRADAGAKGQGDVRRSVMFDADQKPYVVVDADILRGVPKSQWVRTVKNTFKQLYPDGIDMGFFRVKQNADSRNEYTNSKYTQKLRSKNAALYRKKMRMVNNLGEIVQNAYGTRNEGLKHPRNDNYQSFNHGTIDVRIGAQDYNVQVVTAIDGYNNEVFYDIVGIQPTKITEAAVQANSLYKDATSADPRLPQMEPGVNPYSMQEGRKYSRPLVSERDQEAMRMWKEMGTESPRFKDFYSGNVRELYNSDGSPKVVYHGTGELFNSFSPDRKGSLTRAESAKLGYFFTSSPLVAQGYAFVASVPQRVKGAQKNFGVVMPCYLSMKNPLVVDMREYFFDDLREHYSDIIRTAKQQNRDGVILKYANDGISVYTEKSDVFVVFEPSQIKSADRNIGLFSSDTDDMRYSRTLAPELAEEHGTIESGEHPANDVLLPRKDGSGSPVRRTYRTAAESRHADERMQAEIEQVLRDGAASYQVSGDREAADYAGATLSREGFDGARGCWNAALESGKTNKNDIALGERLYVEAANRGDYQAAMEILGQVAAEATIAGQKVQAIRLIKRMGPAGELLTLEQTVRKIQKEIEPKAKKLQKNSSEQIESLKKSVVELENELKPVEKKLEQAKQALDAARAERNRILSLEKSAERKSETANKRASEIGERLPGLQESADRAQATWEQAKQALDAARAERDWLKKRIKSYNNRNATTTNLANELEPKLGELWKQLAEAESSYQKAAEDYEVTREILKQAQKRLASVKNRTESLNRREYSDWWNIQAINEKTEAAKQRYREAVEQFEDTRQKRRALEEMKKRINQLEGKISIPQSVVDDILSQKTQKGLDEAMTRAYAEIGKQVPSNWADKWNAWRYMAMLVNPTTHIRNITGNLFFRPAIALKDAIKIPMERALMPRYKGDPTAAFLTGSQTDKGYLAQGRESFEENRRMLMSSGKYNPSNEIRDNMRIFQNGVLEAIRRKNGGALEAEDLVFLRRSYERAYAQVLKANDYAAQDGARQAEIRKQAESWAAEEAWRATYRDASAAADAISRFSRINAATSVVTEGLLPFKKTPINVAKRGLSYSPAGLVKGLYDMTYGVKSGKVDAAHAIDQFASGLSGTAIVALGAYLASQGLLNGAGDDDDKARAYRKQVSGYQQYSLQIGDKSYTIDWLAPSSMPLFVGAELWKLKQGEAASFKGFYEAMKTLPSPMVEMSMLSSLEDAIDAASYGRSGGEKLVNVFGEGFGSYFGQAVPTLGGKINRIIDGTQRNAYYKDKTALVPSDWTVAYNSTIRQKVPGMSKGLEPKLDVWGREQKEGLGERVAENLVSPGYLSHNKETPVDKEILRLYEKTGESSVIPNTSPNKYFPAKNNLPRYDMSAAEYTAYMRVRGTTSYELINQMISSSAYKKMGDEEKANMIGELYQYAGEIAKRRIAPEYANKSMDKAIEICTKANLTYGQYLTVRAQADTDGNGSVSQEEAKKAIDASGLSRKQKSAMWQSFNSKWKNNPYQ